METVLHAFVKLLAQVTRWTTRALSGRLSSKQASSWLLAQGKIARTYRAGDDWETYYTYQVDGSYYSGYFSSSSFPVERQDKAILIRYKPEQPETSFFLDSDQVGPSV